MEVYNINLLKLLKESILLCFIVFTISIVFNTIYPHGYKLKAENDNVIKINTQLAYKFYQKGIKFFDARDYKEYSTIHIDKAYSFPYYEYNNYLTKYIEIIKNSNEVVIYCINEDCGLSSMLAKKLATEFKNTKFYIINGGLEDWLKNNYPVKREK